MRDINSKQNNDAKGHAIILHKMSQGRIEQIKTNRVLLYIITLLLAVIVVMGLYITPTNKLMNDFQSFHSATDINNIEMNPVLSEEINLLKSQLIGLISGSIESKLRILENSIRTGSVGKSALGTIEDLKNDVKVLRTYSESGAGYLIAQKNASVNNSNIKINQQLIAEISQLKNLIYIIIVSCGLMVAAVGGILFHGRYQLTSDNAVVDKTKKLLK